MNYKCMLAGNNSLWDAFRLHNEFHSAMLNMQQGQLSWHVCRCRHDVHQYIGMCQVMWLHDVSHTKLRQEEQMVDTRVLSARVPE